MWMRKAACGNQGLSSGNVAFLPLPLAACGRLKPDEIRRTLEAWEIVTKPQPRCAGPECL